MAAPQAFPAHIFEMMTRLGIDPRGVHWPELRALCASAIKQCEQCRVKSACEVWLDEAPTLLKSPPWFCLNAEILSDLQCDQGRLVAHRLLSTRSHSARSRKASHRGRARLR